MSDTTDPETGSSRVQELALDGRDVQVTYEMGRGVLEIYPLWSMALKISEVVNHFAPPKRL